MPEHPASYRAEPDAAFADRLESALVERLTTRSDSVPMPERLTAPPPMSRVGPDHSTGDEHALVDLDSTSGSPPARHRMALVVLGAAAAAVLVVALAAVIQTDDEPAPADLPPTTTVDHPTTTVTEVPTTTVAPAQPTRAYEGRWVSVDTDGSFQTMEVTRSDGDIHDVVVNDDHATVCGGAPSTMTGTGRTNPDGDLVLPQPVLTCDDDTSPALLDPPLETQLANLTFIHDPSMDELFDSLGIWWRREHTADDAGSATSTRWWPQASLEEVRAAQAMADAGHPGATWQLDAQLAEHGDPGQAEIFGRFLREQLGWEEFRWADFRGHGAGDGTYADIVFVRCQPGATNEMYPDDAVGGDCAPTIDDRRYETASVGIDQPDRRGPTGIWIVTGWTTVPAVTPVVQVPPPEGDAAGSLQQFLQARVDGVGADEHVSANDPIPLLYATTAGLPYERFEFVIGEPEWPAGGREVVIRLFAVGGDIVVEQTFDLIRDIQGGVALEYSHDQYGRAATTENGEVVVVPYTFLDGDVTFTAAPPWRRASRSAFSSSTLTVLERDGSPGGRIALAAGVASVGPDCRPGPVPADAQDLARMLEADPDLEVTAADALQVAGMDGLTLDVTLAPEAGMCDPRGTLVLTNQVEGADAVGDRVAPWALQLEAGSRMRLHLIDMPGGAESGRILAVAIIAPESEFEQVLEAATSIRNSILVHTG